MKVSQSIVESLETAKAALEAAEMGYNDAVTDAAKEGLTQREIASVLGISYSTVARIVKASGATYVRRVV